MICDDFEFTTKYIWTEMVYGPFHCKEILVCSKPAGLYRYKFDGPKFTIV